MTPRRLLSTVTLSLVLVLAGCGASSSTPAPDLSPTPAVVPPATSSPTPTSPATPADPDGDGLSAAAEREFGTDPALADTDGDGLDDALEARGHPRLPGADPLHRDVFVEIDYQEGLRPDPSAFDALREHYAAAPLSNPDGEGGISLHLVVDEAVGPRETVRFGTHLSRYADGPDEGRWYYYGIVVAGAETSGGRPVGGISDGVGTFLLTPQSTPERTRSLLAHELGHTLGVPAFARGVDATTVPHEQYPSVMNYNAPRSAFALSDGTAGPNDLNDWAFVDQGIRVLPATLRFAS